MQYICWKQLLSIVCTFFQLISQPYLKVLLTVSSVTITGELWIIQARTSCSIISYFRIACNTLYLPPPHPHPTKQENNGINISRWTFQTCNRSKRNCKQRLCILRGQKVHYGLFENIEINSSLNKGLSIWAQMTNPFFSCKKSKYVHSRGQVQ